MIRIIEDTKTLDDIYYDIDNKKQRISDFGFSLIKWLDSCRALVKANNGKFTIFNTRANRPLSKIGRQNEYIPLFFNTEEEALNYYNN